MFYGAHTLNIERDKFSLGFFLASMYNVISGADINS